MRHVLLRTTFVALFITGCNTTKDVIEQPSALDETTNTTTQLEDETMTTFTAQQGTITALTQTEDGVFVDATFDNNPVTFLIYPDTPIVTDTGEDTDLQVGMTMRGYVYSNSPMVMIYPPRFTPAIVVVETNAHGFYDISSFNDALVNETNTLRLQNDVLTAGDYAVFYTVTTRSIPAQTTPHRIIAIPDPLATN